MFDPTYLNLEFFHEAEQWFVLIAVATHCHQSPPYMSIILGTSAKSLKEARQARNQDVSQECHTRHYSTTGSISNSTIYIRKQTKRKTRPISVHQSTSQWGQNLSNVGFDLNFYSSTNILVSTFSIENCNQRERKLKIPPFTLSANQVKSKTVYILSEKCSKVVHSFGQACSLACILSWPEWIVYVME